MEPLPISFYNFVLTTMVDHLFGHKNSRKKDEKIKGKEVYKCGTLYQLSYVFSIFSSFSCTFGELR